MARQAALTCRACFCGGSWSNRRRRDNRAGASARALCRVALIAVLRLAIAVLIQKNADPRARSGRLPAPSDSVSRFREMEAACATIAERWQNIEPPAGAILEE